MIYNIQNKSFNKSNYYEFDLYIIKNKSIATGKARFNMTRGFLEIFRDTNRRNMIYAMYMFKKGNTEIFNKDKVKFYSI